MSPDGASGGCSLVTSKTLDLSVKAEADRARAVENALQVGFGGARTPPPRCWPGRCCEGLLCMPALPRLFRPPAIK
jgi:hypothetical protein